MSVSVASYAITIEGQTFENKPGKPQVAGFQTSSDLNQPDSAVIKISNLDEKFKAICKTGKTVEIKAGYDSNNLGSVFKGKIYTAKPRFDVAQSWTMELTAYDALYDLKRPQRSDTSVQQTIQQVVQKVVGRNGLTANFGKTPPNIQWEHLHQLNKSDFDWLQYLALLSNRIVYCIDKTVYFVMRELDKAPVANLSYGKEGQGGLDSFTPDMTDANQIKSVTVASYDYMKAEPLRAKSTADGSPLGTTDGGTDANMHFVLPVYTVEQAQTAADSLLARTQIEKSTGHGVTAGDPNIKLAEIISIDMSGPSGGNSTYGGKFFVSKVEHRYSGDRGMVELIGARGMGGYRTHFHGKRNANVGT